MHVGCCGQACHGPSSVPRQGALVCSIFFFFLSHLNGKLGGSYRDSVGAQTLMGVHGNHSQT